MYSDIIFDVTAITPINIVEPINEENFIIFLEKVSKPVTTEIIVEVIEE